MTKLGKWHRIGTSGFVEVYQLVFKLYVKTSEKVPVLLTVSLAQQLA